MIAQGVIGDCHYVRAFWYRNALPSGAAAWRYPIPAEANPQNADWKRFLGPAPQRDWQKERYFQWRLYWDYSSGIATDLMVHQTDITAFVLDRSFPASLVAAGGINRWVENDDREVPDTWSVLIDYPDRLHVNYSCYLGNAKFGYGEQFCGNEGTLEIVNRSTLNYYPEVYAPGMKEEVKERKELTITIPRNDNLAVEAHLRNWIRSIHGLEKPVAPLQAGFEAAVIGLLSVVAYKQGRKVLWDAKNNKYSLA
jgi:hypothetical protein